MLSTLFYSIGKFCASHPWEMIIPFSTLSLYLMSITPSSSSSMPPLPSLAPDPGKLCHTKEISDGDALLVTSMRCFAFLYVYHQLTSLYRLGSKYLVGIACLCTVLTGTIFASIVISVLNKDFGELFSTALPLFLLLTELPRTRLLAQFALSSRSKAELRENIARGMSVLCPCFTLDMLVKILAIGVGTLSGAKRIEELSHLACISVFVNYITFLTFFPSCLSLALEITIPQGSDRPLWSSLAKVLQLESEQAPNPVIQRVKLIMSAGLTLVHTFSRIQIENTASFSSEQSNTSSDSGSPDTVSTGGPQSSFVPSQNFFGAEKLVLFVIAIALAIKYVFFDRDIENMPFEDSGIRDDCNTSCIKAKSEDLDGKIVTTTKHRSDSDNKKKGFFLGDDDSSGSETGESVKSESEKSSETDRVTDKLRHLLSYATPRDPERSLEELQAIVGTDQAKDLTDDELFRLMDSGLLNSYRLHQELDDSLRAVHVRRLKLRRDNKRVNENFLEKLSYLDYDFGPVNGACCENVVGYVEVPVGFAGPLKLDDVDYFIPMATTEGCLVASVHRGCKVLRMSGGAKSAVVGDRMTRAPVVKFKTAMRAAEVKNWLKEQKNFQDLKNHFDSTSRFARLEEISATVAANNLHIRMVASTGDAMGMNMLSKGAEQAILRLSHFFPDLEVLSISGNMCTDKKPAAVNWIEGRGKSVVCEATIPAEVLEKVLKISAEKMEELNISKNLIGSAMAGSIGGFNAHSANTVSAIFIATGQDPAQAVASSNCLTYFKATGDQRKDLYCCVTMPSIEVGTVGGGTILPGQSACLSMLGVRGANVEDSGGNARRLAQIIAAAVLAGELSIMSALGSGDLVKSHMKHNRSLLSINASPQKAIKKAARNGSSSNDTCVGF